MKRNFVMTIAWNRDLTDAGDELLSAQVIRGSETKAHSGVSQASIERLSRCVDGMRPRVWGGGSYWGGVYQIEDEPVEA